MTVYECSECGQLEGVLLALKHQTENPGHHVREKRDNKVPPIELDDDDESKSFEGPQEQDEYFDETYVSDNPD